VDEEESSVVRKAVGSILHWRGRSLALICLLGMLAFRAIDPAPIEPLRSALFDALQVVKPRAWQDLPVIIVDVDESSLARYGQWPWSRRLIAELVDKIAATGPLSIGFDILFAEPDRYSPNRMLDNYPDIDPQLKRGVESLPSNDTRLAESLARAPTVLGVGALHNDDSAANFRPVKAVPVVERGGEAKSSLIEFPVALQSIPELSAAAKSRAALNAIPEHDGVIRRVPLAFNIGGTVVPTLTIEMLRVAIGAPYIAIHRDEDGITGFAVADVFVPTGPDGRLWINYTPSHAERYVSAGDILDGAVDPRLLQGKLVLFGVTGLGLTDAKATPVAPLMNGIEIHAQLLESMVSGAFLTRPGFVNQLELSLVFVSGLLLILVVPILSPRLKPAPLVGLLTVLCAIAWVAHANLALRVDTTYAGVSAVVVFAFLYGASLIETERLRRLLQIDLDHERAAAERIKGELAAARAIQLGILPSTFPAYPQHSEFDLHAMLEPAKAVGGDLYDFAMLDDDRLFFIVGDVSGKGVPASLFMALTKALYKSSVLRRQVRIEEIMTEANAEISRENPAMMFVTALAGILDIRTGAVEFCNAGHDAPILLSPGQKLSTIPNVGGPPLCVLDDFEYPRDTHQLKPGEAIVLFTDGVTEAMNPDNELYSMGRLEETLSMVPDDCDCASISERLYEDVKEFADGADASDDITILTFRYFGPGETKA
jgi:serine phosphatase RsbU (regulator of sigma subunit)